MLSFSPELKNNANSKHPKHKWRKGKLKDLYLAYTNLTGKIEEDS